MNFLGGQKFEVCFCASYLHLNESTRAVDLMDFHENRPECSSDITHKRVEFKGSRAYLNQNFDKFCFFRNLYLTSFIVIYSF